MWSGVVGVRAHTGRQTDAHLQPIKARADMTMRTEELKLAANSAAAPGLSSLHPTASPSRSPGGDVAHQGCSVPARRHPPPLRELLGLLPAPTDLKLGEFNSSPFPPAPQPLRNRGHPHVMALDHLCATPCTCLLRRALVSSPRTPVLELRMGKGLGHGGKNHHEKKPQAPSSEQGGGCAPGITPPIISTQTPRFFLAIFKVLPAAGRPVLPSRAALAVPCCCREPGLPAANSL